jgi:hypothetical protein
MNSSTEPDEHYCPAIRSKAGFQRGFSSISGTTPAPASAEDLDQQDPGHGGALAGHAG